MVASDTDSSQAICLFSRPSQTMVKHTELLRRQAGQPGACGLHFSRQGLLAAAVCGGHQAIHRRAPRARPAESVSSELDLGIKPVAPNSRERPITAGLFLSRNHHHRNLRILPAQQHQTRKSRGHRAYSDRAAPDPSPFSPPAAVPVRRMLAASASCTSGPSPRLRA